VKRRTGAKGWECEEGAPKRVGHLYLMVSFRRLGAVKDCAELPQFMTLVAGFAMVGDSEHVPSGARMCPRGISRATSGK